VRRAVLGEELEEEYGETLGATLMRSLYRRVGGIRPGDAG